MKYSYLLLVLAVVVAIASACTYTQGDNEYSLESLKGMQFTDNSETGNQMIFSFCEDLPDTVCTKCSIVSKPGIGPGTPHASNTAEPSPTTSPPLDGDKWDLGLVYTNAPATNPCPTRIATVRFSCADANSATVTTIPINSCDFNFDFATPAVCNPNKAGGGLSGGAIFLIIFFSILAAYFIIGSILCKFVFKKQGLDIIPQHSFWCALPGLFVAGVKHLIGCFTKKGSNSSSNRIDSSEEGEYGAV